MQLSAGRWHSSAPPDVVAVDAPGRRFAISLFDESGSGGEREETLLGTYSGEARVALSEAGLADGNYRIVLNELTPSGNVGPTSPRGGSGSGLQTQRTSIHPRMFSWLTKVERRSTDGASSQRRLLIRPVEEWFVALPSLAPKPGNRRFRRLRCQPASAAASRSEMSRACCAFSGGGPLGTRCRAR